MRKAILAIPLVFTLSFGCESGDPDPSDASDTSASDGTVADTSDTSTSDTGTSDTSMSDTNLGDTGTGDTSAGDTSAGDTSAGDTSAGDTSASDAVGPGLPADAKVSCLVETDLATGFFLGAQKKCSAFVGPIGATTQAGLEAECTYTAKGTLVPSCPTADVVAYCVGPRWSAEGNLTVTNIIYRSAVSPDAAFVAKNIPGICMMGGTAYDSDGTPLSSTCTGTVKASVDGTPVTFDDLLICSARTDGVRTAYKIRAAKHPAEADNQELTLTVVKSASGTAAFLSEMLQPAFGYLEGGEAGGAFAYPSAGATATIDASAFALDGSGLKATFEIGTLGATPGGGGAQRAITAGSVEIHLD
jgi:hypothetical protein